MLVERDELQFLIIFCMLIDELIDQIQLVDVQVGMMEVVVDEIIIIHQLVMVEDDELDDILENDEMDEVIILTELPV